MTNKSTYTKKVHIHRLRLMLKRDDPCGCCPAAKMFNAEGYPNILWKDYPNICNVCRSFIGLHPITVPDANYDWAMPQEWFDEASDLCDMYSIKRCPCNALGPEEALKQTILALKKET